MSEEAKKYTINGYEIICDVCSNDAFYKSSAQLNTAISTFFGFDWANKSATCLTCNHCSQIKWFYQKVK